MIFRRPVVLAAILCTIALAGAVKAQPIEVPATHHPALEQLPILFHHGFNDDGRAWAVGPDGRSTGSPADYWDRLEILSAQGELLQRGVPTYVVQYWAQSDAAGFVDGDPNATADEGWAAFKSPQEIRTRGENYNSPDPISYFLANADQLFNVIPDCSVTPTSVTCTYPQQEFLAEVNRRMITSNYNRNGLVEHHSEDFAELLGHVFTTDDRFRGLRQVNVITHSAGGLDTRATLHRLNESEDPIQRERMANVIYMAPPFGGSTTAIFAVELFSDDLTPDVWQNPWIRNAAGTRTVAELVLAIGSSFGGPDGARVAEILLGFVPLTFGFDPYEETVNELIEKPKRAEAAVALVLELRELVTGILGFPGEPKVSQDLTPWSAVRNLNRWQPNFNTKQFVTWAEGGGRINLTTTLPEARNAYDTGGACCEEFLDPGSLQLLPDDWALSNVSARLLASPKGGMVELASYPTLWHGNIHKEVSLVGMDWARTLVAPVTGIELAGPVPTVDHERRYYRVGPTTTLRFTPESRTIRDRFGDEATIVASTVQYRLVTFDLDQTRTNHSWVTIAPNTTITFEELAAGEADLSGERIFLVEWRAVNQNGATEAIRSAAFSIDSEPPSIVLVDVFTPGVENSPEIAGTGVTMRPGMFRRSNLLLDRLDLPNLSLLVGRHEMDWIVRNPANKILRVDFDEPGAIVRYQWDAFFTDPVTQTLPNTTLAFPLAELEPGPHTLYFEVSDQAGNESNAVQAVHILVDDQAPVVGLNYESSAGLGFVVGPETPIEFVAEDVETGRVTGMLTVPGIEPIPVNSNFRLSQTSIADAAEGTGVLGLMVSMQAEVADAVGNTALESFDVYYDFSPPQMDLQYVGNSVLTSSGVYRTTDATVRVEVRVRDNAGYQLPIWTATQPGKDVLWSGGPLVAEARDGRPLANGTNISLRDGVNLIVISVTDLVGNTSSLELIIEKAQTLIEDESNRPIELLSIHLDGAPTGGTGPANVGTSDDGTAFIFDSSRRDHVADDTNGERDIFVWHNGTVFRANTTSSGDEAVGGESRNPALSGNGRFAYFASEATNLVPESTSGLNLYVKDLATGRVGLISRDRDGNPMNLNPVFGRLSFLRLSATYDGRYVFFDDRFDGYVDGDENQNLDIFVADLDPDVNGDFFDTLPVIRRVSVAPDGAEGTGGGFTGGSRYPSASRDGLFVAFQTTHTNLFDGDDNDTQDAVLARFAGVDAQGTIDFSSISIIPLAVDAQGNVSAWGSDHPTIDRTGRTVVFATSANLLQNDTNQEGVDSDVYRSTGFLENWKNRVLELVSVDASGAPGTGRIAPNHAPTVSDYTAANDPRTAYLTSKPGIVEGDLNNAIDLFVHADHTEAINWIAGDVPTTISVLEGGITPNGQYAWWVTNEEYSTVVGAGTGRDLYRRRIDPEAETEAPQIVTSPADISALVGEDIAFTVAASGRPAPSYQWSRDGLEIPGATNATLFIENVDFDDEGSYAVTLTNEAGTTTSASAKLRVTSLVPTFLAEPEALEVREGEPATLKASVVGLAPVVYQWSRDGLPLVDDNRIVGATTDSLHITTTELADSGTYVLRATNPGGETSSSPITLTVVEVTGTDDVQALPTSYALDQNYPNPFNPSTTIRYALPQQSRVRLEVFNVLGQRVKVLVDDVQPAGWHSVTMDGSSLASGAYFYVITAGSYTHARSFHLLK